MYADDLAIYSFAPDLQKAVDVINKDLLQLNIRYSELRLRLNARKSQVPVLSGEKSREAVDLAKTTAFCMLDGTILRYSDSVTYLGVKIDGSLSWNSQITSLRGKLGSSIRALKVLSATVLITHCKMLYHAFTESFLRYCSPVFSSSGITAGNGLQVLQNHALRAIYGLGRKTPMSEFWQKHSFMSVEQLWTLRLAEWVFRLRNCRHRITAYLVEMFPLKDHSRHHLRRTTKEVSWFELPFFATSFAQNCF